MIAIRSRQSSSSFMRISEPDCATSPASSLKRHGGGAGKKWSGRLRLKQREEPSGTKIKSVKNSFIKNFRYSFNAKFTILSLVFLVLFMTGSAAAAPVDEETSSATTATATTSTSASSTSSETPAATGDTVETTGGTVETPTLFDTVTISSNTTAASCPIFFSKFLSDSDFLECLPLSALLLNSQSYFEITKQGGFATTQVVDKTCNVDVNKCQAVMEKLGWQITLEENCGADFKLGNPLVNQAYAAFIAYKPVYAAGCLKSDSGSYCYVDAMTNQTSPSDAYVYYLPLGRTFPGGSRPTCSTCLSKTMKIFAASAGNDTQPLFDTYTSASQQINFGCGPDFSNSTVEIQLTNTARNTFSPAPLLLLTLMLVISAIINM